jgi:hypothetical protein
MAICHSRSDDEEGWKMMLQKSKGGDIRIRTSTATRAGHEHSVVDGVIVLELQISHDPAVGGFNANEWRVIIGELQKDGVALGIVGGKIPTSLVKYFGLGELEVLPALAILCQGYLLVCDKRGLGKDIPESMRQTFERLSDVETPVTKVQSHDFWDVFDEDNREKVVKAARSEWDGLTGSGKLGDVEALIRALPTQDKPLKDADVPMVAAAYKAIAARMGASVDQ